MSSQETDDEFQLSIEISGWGFVALVVLVVIGLIAGYILFGGIR